MKLDIYDLSDPLSNIARNIAYNATRNSDTFEYFLILTPNGVNWDTNGPAQIQGTLLARVYKMKHSDWLVESIHDVFAESTKGFSIFLNAFKKYEKYYMGKVIAKRDKIQDRESYITYLYDRINKIRTEIISLHEVEIGY